MKNNKPNYEKGVENTLYHLKHTRNKLEDLNNMKLQVTGLDELLDINENLPWEVRERDRLVSKLCEVEKFLDRKKNHVLCKFNNVLMGRKFLGINAAHIKKYGWRPTIKCLYGKADVFANEIRDKIVEQNLKVEHGVYYDMELVFFKEGRNKYGGDIIVSIIREENGVPESLMWVGMVGGTYYIIY